MKSRTTLFCIPIIITFSVFCSTAAIIKPGDVVSIQVLQHPEFSGKYSVNDQGIIDYPLLIDHPVMNASTSELLQELTFLLARHIDNPLVMITIIDKPEIMVTVLGEINKPGSVTMIEGATVQEAIIAAGGPIVERADLSRIKIIHAADKKHPELFDLASFLVHGDLSTMPELAPNDFIIVLSQEKSRTVKVIGAVQKPGLFTLDEPMNLFEVIYLAGGPSEKADLTRVRRFTSNSSEKTIEEVIDIAQYIDNGAMERIPEVTEGDVIIVYSKWLDWKIVLTVLNNTLLFIVTIQAFAGIFN